jgi:hypothetical protein
MRIPNQLAPTAQNGFGVGQQPDSNQLVQQLVMELIRAVFTAMMQQGQPGLPQGDGFSNGAGLPGGALGSPSFAGNGVPATQGGLPQILGGGCGAAPNLGNAFNDPRKTPGSFDAGRFLAQRLMGAIPGVNANGANPAGPCGCPGTGVNALKGPDPQANAPNANPQLALNDGAPGKAPDFFDALNVPKELRGATEGCGPKGCCRWEVAIA